MCIVESLLEVHAFHSHVKSYEECKWRCTFTLLWWNNVLEVYFTLSVTRTVKLSLDSSWYHMHVEVSRTFHALENWWNVSYMTMWISDYVHRWTLVNVVSMWKGDFVYVVLLYLYAWWLMLMWKFIVEWFN